MPPHITMQCPLPETPSTRAAPRVRALVMAAVYARNCKPVRLIDRKCRASFGRYYLQSAWRPESLVDLPRQGSARNSLIAQRKAGNAQPYIRRRVCSQVLMPPPKPKRSHGRESVDAHTLPPAQTKNAHLARIPLMRSSLRCSRRSVITTTSLGAGAPWQAAGRRRRERATRSSHDSRDAELDLDGHVYKFLMYREARANVRWRDVSCEQAHNAGVLPLPYAPHVKVAQDHVLT